MSDAVYDTDTPRLLVVVGPTASGKSLLAARLAKCIGGEVVSADSVQVYRHFDIGAGKPSREERALAPHHLIDCADPMEPIEASAWATMAQEVIAGILRRERVPVVCGGTFLWIRALLYGLAEAPAGDAVVRARHQRLIEVHGRGYLHARLREVDAPSALRLHENDFVRVSRALEVYEISGRRLSDLQSEHGFRRARYRATLLRIAHPPDEYERRLSTRVRGMLQAGLRDEVLRLHERGYGDTRAMESVGYKQVYAAVLAGEEKTDDELVAEIVRVSRIFARRQRTWLRDQPTLTVAPSALSDDAALQEVVASLDSALHDAERD